MYAFADRALLSALIITLFAGCTKTPPAVSAHHAALEARGPGVTANSGGDTRGTVLFDPNTAPSDPTNPYALTSDKFVLPQRQKMAYELGEIDLHAHLQAENAFPVPSPSAPGYSKKKAIADAEHQAEFNAYLLEKYHARFCAQFGVSYEQLALIIQEGRDKNWPMPPVPQE